MQRNWEISRTGCARKGKETYRVANTARWEKKKGKEVVYDLDRNGSMEKHC